MRPKISNERRGTRDAVTPIPFALSLSKGSPVQKEEGKVRNRPQVMRNRTVLLAPRHSLLVPARIRAQGGFAIAAAIFLIVVLALLAAGMVQISSTSHTSLSEEYTSARAYLAARSGLQWGMYQAIYGGSGNTSMTFSGGALAGTQASVSSRSTNVDGNTFYTIDATGTYGSSSDPEYSRRRLRLRFKP
ncbi:MAG TPA: hypothetical protein ENI68_02930 [Gammaproteobacteria bacterium]|nr:hypothetical protein [Gammaproteobacteria bacterium]